MLRSGRKHAAVIENHVLDEGGFELEAGIPYHPFGLAELQHQGLFGLMNREHGTKDEDDEANTQDADDGQNLAVHFAPPWVRFWISGKGR